MSLEERYSDLETYLAQLEAECQSLVKTGYLLAEDVDPIIARQRKRASPLFDASSR